MLSLLLCSLLFEHAYSTSVVPSNGGNDFADVNIKDYVEIEFDIKFDTPTATSVEKYGNIYRIGDESDIWDRTGTALYQKYNGEVQIYAAQKNGGSPLWYWGGVVISASSLVTTKTYHFKIRYSQSRLKVYIDNDNNPVVDKTSVPNHPIGTKKIYTAEPQQPLRQADKPWVEASWVTISNWKITSCDITPEDMGGPAEICGGLAGSYEVKKGNVFSGTIKCSPGCNENALEVAIEGNTYPVATYTPKDKQVTIGPFSITHNEETIEVTMLGTWDKSQCVIDEWEYAKQSDSLAMMVWTKKSCTPSAESLPLFVDLNNYDYSNYYLAIIVILAISVLVLCIMNIRAMNYNKEKKYTSVKQYSTGNDTDTSL